MIKILVDSASDIFAEEAEELGVSLIPMQIRFGTDEYYDGVNLSHTEFFAKLMQSAELPQTSQINEYRFNEKFEELTTDGDDVVAIVLSSKLSGTYECAVRAAEKFGGKVHVVDSMNASAGEKILCLYALRLAKDGATAEQIVEELDRKKSKVRFLALLGTLEYLKKGGRISSATAAIGKMFSVKPVISIADGAVKMEGKAIGSKKGSNLLTKFVDMYGIDFDMPYVLVYSGLSDELLDLYVRDSEKLWKNHANDLPRHLIGSTIGTHIGPDGIGVAFFAK